MSQFEQKPGESDVAWKERLDEVDRGQLSPEKQKDLDYWRAQAKRGVIEKKAPDHRPNWERTRTEPAAQATEGAGQQTKTSQPAEDTRPEA